MWYTTCRQFNGFAFHAMTGPVKSRKFYEGATYAGNVPLGAFLLRASLRPPRASPETRREMSPSSFPWVRQGRGRYVKFLLAIYCLVKGRAWRLCPNLGLAKAPSRAHIVPAKFALPWRTESKTPSKWINHFDEVDKILFRPFGEEVLSKLDKLGSRNFEIIIF